MYMNIIYFTYVWHDTQYTHSLALFSYVYIYTYVHMYIYIYACTKCYRARLFHLPFSPIWASRKLSELYLVKHPCRIKAG